MPLEKNATVAKGLVSAAIRGGVGFGAVTGISAAQGKFKTKRGRRDTLSNASRAALFTSSFGPAVKGIEKAVFRVTKIAGLPEEGAPIVMKSFLKKLSEEMPDFPKEAVSKRSKRELQATIKRHKRDSEFLESLRSLVSKNGKKSGQKKKGSGPSVVRSMTRKRLLGSVIKQPHASPVKRIMNPKLAGGKKGLRESIKKWIRKKPKKEVSISQIAEKHKTTKAKYDSSKKRIDEKLKNTDEKARKAYDLLKENALFDRDKRVAKALEKGVGQGRRAMRNKALLLGIPAAIGAYHFGKYRGKVEEREQTVLAELVDMVKESEQPKEASLLQAMQVVAKAAAALARAAIDPLKKIQLQQALQRARNAMRSGSAGEAMVIADDVLKSL